MSDCTGAYNCPAREHILGCYNGPSEDEARVRVAAAEVFTPEGVDIWMNAPNRSLNNATPTQYIAAGDTERVLDLIQALAEGMTG